MSGILLSSQMDLYYNLRNVFFVLFGILAAITIIYGIKVKIILIIQKYFGIEERREIARMQSGKGNGRKTSARVKALQQSGRIGVSGTMSEKLEIDVSKVTTMKLQKEQVSTLLEEVAETTMQEEQETMVLESQSETTVLGSQSETTVLDSGTMVLDGQSEPVILNSRPDIRFRIGKNVIIVHGEDIF